MRIAVIYKEKDIFVEFKTEKFLKLLKEYFKKTGDLDLAMEQIIKDLKNETKRK